jgi:NADPH2:quinone reductase
VYTWVTRYFFFSNGLGYPPGSYAEYTVVQEDYLALKPKNLSMVEAAAIPLALITAWEALVIRGDLKEGQSMLIHAGAGGVGHIAIQLAHYLTRSSPPPFQVRRRRSLCDR